MKYFFGLLMLILPLWGCHYGSSPVQPAGKDTFMVTSHVAGCINCNAAVESIKTATEHCGKLGKVISIKHTNSTTNPFGYVVDNQLLFSCIFESNSTSTGDSQIQKAP